MWGFRMRANTSDIDTSDGLENLALTDFSNILAGAIDHFRCGSNVIDV